MKLVKYAASLVVLAGLATPAVAAEMEIKFGHVGAPGSLFDMVTTEFAKRANERLAGKAKVVVYGSSQLGADKEMMQMLKLGTMHMTLPSTIMSSVVEQFGLFEMPYLVKDRAHMKRIENEIFWAKLEPLVEAKGYKVIALWENGFRHITNNVRPIVTPADLKGIKLRTPKGVWRVKMFQSYGANPSPMSFSEVFVALQTGVMDGQENPLIQIYSAKFQEVQKYLSMTGHVYSPAYVVVGKQKWESLPADVRNVLEQTARELQAFVYQKAGELDSDLLAKLKAGGIQVNEADKDAFIEASKPIYEEFSAKVPGAKEMIETALKLGSSS